MAAPRLRSPARWLWPLLLAAAALVAILEWDVPGREPARPATAPAPRSAERDAAEPVEDRLAPHRSSRPAPPQVLAPSDTPAAPALADVESHCHGIGAFGACEGNRALACVSNTLYRVDCAAHGMRCAITDEGAQCLPANDPLACSGKEPAQCVGQRLRRCVDGSFQEIDCEKRGGACEAAPGGARCVFPELAAGARGRAAIEICDGHDNDQDGRVDENDVCAAVPLVAFIPAGYEPPQLETRMQVELAILNQVFAPQSFRWQKTTGASAAYRSFSPKQLEAAARELARSEQPSFYVPVLYVEDLVMDPPKAAISTMPNNTCGGIRVSDRPAPAEGVIVLGEARQPETLAHEMGHYLGLCHTHQELAPLAPADAQAPSCKKSGDAICDTPPDPGPARCVREQLCEIACPRDGAQPDPTNIMSYYIGCRRVLTPDQLLEAERNLSLRRGWFPCLDAASCQCGAGANSCPYEMSCQPGASLDAAWSCQLDGPSLPGSACSDSSQCGHGAFCLQLHAPGRSAARCVRPCQTGDACNCTDVGLPFSICAEDLPDAFLR